MTTAQRRNLVKAADRLLGNGKKQRKKRGNKPSSIPSRWAMTNRAKLLKKPNLAEEHVEALLKKVGILYTREAPVRFNSKEYFMDFAVETCFGIVDVEIDGTQHFSGIGQAKDRKRDAAIIESGEAIVVVRLSWKRAMALDREIHAMLMWACAWPSSVILRY